MAFCMAAGGSYVLPPRFLLSGISVLRRTVGMLPKLGGGGGGGAGAAGPDGNAGGGGGGGGDSVTPSPAGDPVPGLGEPPPEI